MTTDQQSDGTTAPLGDGTYTVENRIATMPHPTRMFLGALPVPAKTWPKAPEGTHLKTLSECGLAVIRGDMWVRTERGDAMATAYRASMLAHSVGSHPVPQADCPICRRFGSDDV